MHSHSEHVVAEPRPGSVVARFTLKLLAAACVVAVVAGVSWAVLREGWPSLGGWVLVGILAAPVVGSATLAWRTSNELLRGRRLIPAFLLLAAFFLLTWILAWESQMYEPGMTIRADTRSGDFLIGIRPPAPWNFGRVLFGGIATAAAVGAASLLTPAAMKRYRRSTGLWLLVSTAVTIAATAVSVPILQAREQGRREHARDSCTRVWIAQGAAQHHAQALCENPYDEAFIQGR